MDMNQRRYLLQRTAPYEKMRAGVDMSNDDIVCEQFGLFNTDESG